jgi:hypothetical protein
MNHNYNKEEKIYNEICRKDFERKIYKQIDKEETDELMKGIDLKEWNKAWEEYDKDQLKEK